MRQWQTFFNVHTLVFIIISLFPIGLLFAPYLLSICMISSAVVAVFALDFKSKYGLKFRPALLLRCHIKTVPAPNSSEKIAMNFESKNTNVIHQDQ